MTSTLTKAGHGFGVHWYHSLSTVGECIFPNIIGYLVHWLILIGQEGRKDILPGHLGLERLAI